MARAKSFFFNLFSSYAAIAVNLVYTLISVPLALHYLDKDEFGLWALITQISGYLLLFEMGMSGSVARSLVDHKDNVEGGDYGTVLRTGAWVFGVQGLMIVCMGVIVAWVAPPLLGLADPLRHPFRVLMMAQAVISGLKIGLGSMVSPLWCHQRLDLSNLAGSCSLVVSFVVLWIGFHFGWQVYSLAAAAASGLLVSIGIIYGACSRFGFYPKAEHRGRFDRKIFRELLSFGSGLFLMNLGSQLASASQLILISRLMGIEAAAVWAIGTKIFALSHQFVARIFDSSAGTLAEMVVRQEYQLLQQRFRDLVGVTAVAAVGASAMIALGNGAFMEIWTSGRVAWAPWNNLLLALVFFSTSATRCHLILVGVTKEIRGMKYIYLLEGVLFVTLSLLLVPRFGLTGLLIAALTCNAGISGAYGIYRSANYFEISSGAVLGWFRRSLGILLLIATLFTASHGGPVAALAAPWRFAIGALTVVLVVLPVIWFFGLDSRIRAEIWRMAALLGSKVRTFFQPNLSA